MSIMVTLNGWLSYRGHNLGTSAVAGATGPYNYSEHGHV